MFGGKPSLTVQTPGTTGFGTSGAPAVGASGTGSFFGGGGAQQPGAAPGFGGGTSTGMSPFGATPRPGAGQAGFGGFQPASSVAPTGFGAGTSTGFGASKGFGTATSGGFGTSGGGGFGNTLGGSSGFSTMTSKPLFNTGGGATSTSTGFGNTMKPFGAPGTTSLGGTMGGMQGFQQAPSAFGTGAYGAQQQQPQQLGWSGAGMQQSQFAPNMMGAPYPGAPATGPQTSKLHPMQTLEVIRDSYNPANPYCRFRHMFYNVVHPEEALRYVRPPNTNDILWSQAIANNPDPSRLVPVQAVGFEELKLRLQEQDKMVELHLSKLKEMEKSIDAMYQKHNLETAITIDQHRHRQMELTHRVLVLMRKVEILQNKGVSVLSEETALKMKLEELQRELNKPAQFKGRLGELASIARSMAVELPPDVGEGMDEENLATIRDFLDEQRKGIVKLLDVLKQDLKDVETMAKGWSSSM